MKKGIIYFLLIVISTLIIGFALYTNNLKAHDKALEEQPIAQQNDTIQNDIIYFFSHKGCPYCNDALTYIKNNYNSLPITILDVEHKNNLELFIKCADKFRLDKRSLGTPLICIGNNYILGWNRDNEKKFDEYIIQFQNNNK